MGIPPTRMPPQPSTPGKDTSSDKVEGKKPQKEFKLPKKGEEEGEQKGLQPAPEQQAVKAQIEEGQISEEISTQAPVAGTQAAQVAKVGELISQMVARLGVGTIEGKNFASLDLKGTADVPVFLANTTLTLTQTDNGLVVNFSNFESLSQQQTAILTMEKQTEQLQLLVNNLSAKGIQLADLTLGTYSISLPPPQAVTPIQPPPITAEAKREEGRRGGEEKGGGGPEGGPE